MTIPILFYFIFLLCLNWNYEENTAYFPSGFILHSSSTSSKILQQHMNLFDVLLFSIDLFLFSLLTCLPLCSTEQFCFDLNMNYTNDYNSDHYQS